MNQQEQSHGTHFRRTRPATSICVVLFLLLLAVTPASANAAFSRSFLRQISGSFHGLQGGIAVDSSDDLWVGGGAAGGGKAFSLNEFKPASELNVFERTIEIEGSELPENQFGEIAGPTPPESLALDSANGDFYTDGAGTRPKPGSAPQRGSVEVFDESGTYLQRFSELSGSVAVDNSAEPSSGAVYVASSSEHAISKFNAAGEPIPFSESGKVPYVSGNQITGFLGGTHSEFQFEEPRFVAVDSHGDIYTTSREYSSEGHHDAAILEYAPSGAFIRAFRGTQTPGLGESVEAGFGGQIEGLAVDPLSGDVVVSITQRRETPQGFRPVEGVIDEFDSSGRYLGQTTGTTQGGHLVHPSGLVVDSEGDLYVIENEAGEIDVYGPGHFVPGLRLSEPSQRTPTEALLRGAVNAEAGANPEHSGLSACRFEYVTEAVFQETGFADLSSGGEVPCEPSAGAIPADEEFHSVQAAIGGLTSGTTYRYRLTASISGEKGGTASTAAFAFTTPHAPAVEALGADNLSSTFADLHATINPLGAATSYQFEYLTSAAFAENGESFEGPTAPVGAPTLPAAIGSGGGTGSSAEAVLQHLGNLAPTTSYRFRVIASNEIGSTIAEGSFATLPAVEPGLPDSRAYELVTPANKGSAEDMFGEPETNGTFRNGHNYGVVSDSGDQLLFEARAAFGPFPASSQNSYVFTRTTEGWTFKSLASPGSGVQNIGAATVLSDPSGFGRVAFLDLIGSSASEAGARSYSLLGAPGGPYTTLHIGPVAHFEFGGTELDKEEAQIVGASRDLSTVVIGGKTLPDSKTNPLCAGMETLDESSRALCEYRGGELQPVNVKTNGALLNRCGAALGGDANIGVESYPGKTRHAVSADGSRVFFTAPDPGATNKGPGCWNEGTSNTPQIYLRSGGVTTQISAPEAGVSDPSGQHYAQYVGAAEDGSRVYFFSEGELTGDDEGIHDGELYEWRNTGVGGCESSNGCLNRASKGESGEAAGGVIRVPLISNDGTVTYFMANGVLASNQGGDGTTASSGNCTSSSDDGTCNLYRYDSVTGSTTYVSRIDRSDWGSQFGIGIGLSDKTDWYATPDNRYLLFGSTRDLTGYDTTGCGGMLAPTSQGTAGHCQELYRYDSVSGELACVSCNPSGAPPLNHAQFSRSADPTLSGETVRAMSDDGEEVFFDSADPLVPQDINGTLDVYEWHRGELSLISSGTDFAPSFFLGASPDGSNVFIGTHSRLVPQDTDSQGDVYDTRVGGGFSPPSELAPCEGDACAPALPAPNDPTPGSATFFGSGNESQAVRKHKKHSKKKHKKSKHSRKHHKRPASQASRRGHR